MTFSPNRHVIVEAKNLTANAFSYGTMLYIFQTSASGNNYWITGGAWTINDEIGLVSVSGSPSLPVGNYAVNAEVVIEVSASGYGDTFTFGNITGTTPSLAYNQLNSNATIVRSFSEYSLGSNDYVKTSLRFDLEVTTPQGLLSAQYANVVDSIPYMKIIFTKID